MSARAPTIEAPASPAGSLSPDDLAELIATFNDVTRGLQATQTRLASETERLRAQLRDANERLQRGKRLAALGEMAAGIAHEVRNPLASIGLYARMLAEDLQDRPEQRACAEKIGAAVRDLNAVVGDVLHLARDLRIRRSPHDPAALVEAACASCAADVPTDAVLLIAAEPGLEPIACDGAQVRTALVNLIRNALQALEAPGGVRVEVTSGPLDEDAGDVSADAAVFRVRDTGRGIPVGALERMFNPFFTTRETGTGLGLAIVHRIVDAHGGRVGAWNNTDRSPGEPGATVEIRLPRKGGSGGEEGQEHAS